MSKFDWHSDDITRDTPVTEDFVFTANVQTFLLEECGANFKATKPFMMWVRDRQKKTMGAVADEWRRQQGLA